MPAPRRSAVVMTIAVILAVVVWVTVLPGLISVSTAMWCTLAIALGGYVGVKFRRHIETPDSMHLS